MMITIGNIKRWLWWWWWWWCWWWWM